MESDICSLLDNIVTERNGNTISNNSSWSDDCDVGKTGKETDGTQDDVINNNCGVTSPDMGHCIINNNNLDLTSLKALEDEILSEYLPADEKDIPIEHTAGSVANSDSENTNDLAQRNTDVPTLTFMEEIILVEDKLEDIDSAGRQDPNVNTSSTPTASGLDYISHSMPLAALTMNLSFAGCGFLGIYHLGVVHSFAHHGPKLLLNVQGFGGASAGSLVASALAIRGLDKDVLQDCIKFCYDLAASIRSKKMGLLTPKLCVLTPLHAFLSEMLPEDAHLIARNRLYISVTEKRSRKLKNHVVSEFSSKDELIQYLLGSSYIPFMTSSKPVKVDGKKYMDGGMTDNLPVLPQGRTILVTPFSGKQDICPIDKLGKGWYVNLKGADFQVNANNLKRGLHALFPPKKKHMDMYFERGKSDAIRFLKRENFYTKDDSQ